MPSGGIRFQHPHFTVQVLEKVDRTGEGRFKFGCVVHSVNIVWVEYKDV